MIVVIIPWNRHHGRMRICKGILIRPQMTAVFLQIRSAVRKGMHIFTSLTHAHNRNPCNHCGKSCRKQNNHRNAATTRNRTFREKRIRFWSAFCAVGLIIRTKGIHVPPKLLHAAIIISIGKIAADFVPDGICIRIRNHFHCFAAGHKLPFSLAHIQNENCAAVILPNAQILFYIKLCAVFPC